jgi:hypothetical protein
MTAARKKRGSKGYAASQSPAFTDSMSAAISRSCAKSPGATCDRNRRGSRLRFHLTLNQVLQETRLLHIRKQLVPPDAAMRDGAGMPAKSAGSFLLRGSFMLRKYIRPCTRP